MKCNYHPEVEAVSTCTVCGKAVCQSCAVDVAGRSTCQHCLSMGKVKSVQTQSSNPTNPLAIASLIMGILGLCAGIFAIPAWITGNIAQKQIAENPNQEGMQLAKAGKTLGMVITILYGTLLLCYIVAMASSLIASLFQ